MVSTGRQAQGLPAWTGRYQGQSQRLPVGPCGQLPDCQVRGIRGQSDRGGGGWQRTRGGIGTFKAFPLRPQYFLNQSHHKPFKSQTQEKRFPSVCMLSPDL